MSQYTQFGYLAGGSIGLYATATLEKISFATGISTFLGNTALGNTTGYATGVSEGTRKGYVAGGNVANVISSSVQKISYFVDTVSFLSSVNLVYPRMSSAGVDGDGIKGYVCGGYGSSINPTYPADTAFNYTDRITYSSDTSNALTSANINLARFGAGAVSNQSTKGYILGGLTVATDFSSTTAFADQITYSTETTAANTSANLSLARGFVASLSNPSLAGYVSCGGGFFVTYQTDKITFSTDTTASLTSASVNFPLMGPSGVSGTGRGFITGGADYSQPYPSLPTGNYQLDFATETISTDATWFLSVPRKNMAALSGYVAFGYADGSGYAIVDGTNPITNCLLIFSMNGSVTLSGGDGYKFILKQTGSGDITLSGDANSVQLYKWSRRGSGTIVLSGDPLYRGPYIGSGTIVLSNFTVPPDIPEATKYKFYFNNLAQGGTVYVKGSALAKLKIPVPTTPITPAGSLVPVFAATTGGSSTYMPDLAISVDGVNWVNYLQPDGSLSDVGTVYTGNNKLVLIRYKNQFIYFTTDGIGWDKRGLGTFGDWRSGTYGNDLYFSLFPVGVNFNNLSYYGSILTGIPTVAGGWSEIVFLNGFAFITQKGLLSDKLAWSTVGYYWEVVTLPFPIVQGDLLWNGSNFIIYSSDASYALVSSDLITWQLQIFNTPVILKNVVYAGGFYVGISSDGTYAAKSSDLLNYLTYALPSGIEWDKIKYNDSLNTFVVTGYSISQNKSYYLNTSDFFLSTSVSSTVYTDKRIISLTTGLLAYTPPVTPTTPVTPATPTTPVSPPTTPVSPPSSPVSPPSSPASPATPVTPVTPVTPTPIPPQYYSGFGQIVLGGSAAVTADYEIEVSIALTYAVLAEVNKSLPITYQIGQVITYGYRIEGKCAPLTQPQVPFTNPDTTCKARSLNLIFATSTKAVCQELSRQNWIWPIQSMKKYSKPVYKSEEDLLISSGNYDPNNVRFIDITNFCDEPECLDFCVDYIVEENMSLTFYGGLLDSFITGSGTVFVYGTAPQRTEISKYYYSANPNGQSIVLSGTAHVSSNAGKTNYYTGSGTVVLGGSTSIGNYLGSYEMEFSGDMEVEEYVPQFAVTSGVPLDILPSNTSLSKCGCFNLYRRLSLITNLNKVSDFYYFLNRNGLTFNETLLAYYKENTGTYNYAQHFKGISSNVNAKETWTITSDISCAQDLDNFDDNQVWIFDLYIRKYTVGYNDLDTNIQIWIPSNLMCPATRGRQVYFDLQINVKTKTCLINDTTVIQNIFINDQIRLFKSTGWLDDPILTIQARGTV